jgi:hypothetical protein
MAPRCGRRSCSVTLFVRLDVRYVVVRGFLRWIERWMLRVKGLIFVVGEDMV